MSYDIAIVGAGIAGASLAAEIAPHARVLLLEAEDQPGYHATGRSAAFWSETYGGAGVQPLTTASGPILGEGGFLEPLGSLHIGREADRAAYHAFLVEFADTPIALEAVDPHIHVAGLKPEWTLGIWEPSCAYIDVAALHAHYLADVRRAGGELRTRAAVRQAERVGGRWRITTDDGVIEAEILVDAAGAWANQVACIAGVKPIAITAYRRTLIQLRTDPPTTPTMPHVAAIDGSFYWKPEAGGKLWLSPHDEIPTDACDAQPEELEVAIAIDRLEHAVDWRIMGVDRKWAGLRSFAPDRLPVYGFAADTPGFFWFAGQGGFGIQTAPAAAMIGASLLLGRTPDAAVASIDASHYAPTRFG